MSLDNQTELDLPEEPTNRPPATHRAKEWLSRPYARHIIILSAIISLLILPVIWFAVHVTNLSGAPASAVMNEIELTMIVLSVVCTPLMAFTLAILVYSLFGWGRVSGDEPPEQEGPAIRTNRVGVFTWITFTSLLAAFLVVWGLIELATITSNSYGTVAADAQPNSEDRIDINVTGQQWMWTFAYPDEGNITTDVLVVPVGTPLYFNVTSKDVIHSFWVVELGIKIDVNPGAITNTGVTPNKLGTFNIRCAELCGLHHAYMQTKMRVVTQEQYDAWVREMGGGKTV